MESGGGSLQIPAAPYNWPHDGSFSPATTALVIVDMQRDFCEPGGYLDSQGYDIAPVQDLILQLHFLLLTFRQCGFQVYHTREGHRADLSTLSSRERFRSKNNKTGMGIGDRGPLGRFLVRGEPGHEIVPVLSPQTVNEPVIDKPGRSAFAHTDFELLLRIKNVKNLVICGVTTDVCVASTMREANDRGFDCLLVEDGTVAAEESLRGATVESVKMEGGIFGAVAKLEDIARVAEKYRKPKLLNSRPS